MALFDATIAEIQDALEVLINDGPHAWSPYLSSWSLKSLGILSKKYKRNDNRGM